MGKKQKQDPLKTTLEEMKQHFQGRDNYYKEVQKTLKTDDYSEQQKDAAIIKKIPDFDLNQENKYQKIIQQSEKHRLFYQKCILQLNAIGSKKNSALEKETLINDLHFFMSEFGIKNIGSAVSDSTDLLKFRKKLHDFSPKAKLFYDETEFHLKNEPGNQAMIIFENKKILFRLNTQEIINLLAEIDYFFKSDASFLLEFTQDVPFLFETVNENLNFIDEFSNRKAQDFSEYRKWHERSVDVSDFFDRFRKDFDRFKKETSSRSANETTMNLESSAVKSQENKQLITENPQRSFTPQLASIQEKTKQENAEIQMWHKKRQAFLKSYKDQVESIRAEKKAQKEADTLERNSESQTKKQERAALEQAQKEAQLTAGFHRLIRLNKKNLELLQGIFETPVSNFKIPYSDIEGLFGTHPEQIQGRLLSIGGSSHRTIVIAELKVPQLGINQPEVKGGIYQPHSNEQNKMSAVNIMLLRIPLEQAGIDAKTIGYFMKTKDDMGLKNIDTALQSFLSTSKQSPRTSLQ